MCHSDQSRLAAAIPVKNFEPVPSGIGEQKQMPAPDFQSEPVAHDPVKAIETLAHVGGSKSHVRFPPSQRSGALSADQQVYSSQSMINPSIMRSEGFENRALQVAGGVLTHNLWVLAEKLREQRKIREQQLRKAA